MPRPTSKQELIAASNAGFEKMNALIDSMSEQEQNTPFGFEDRDRNLRDVLVHLHEWHRMLIGWHAEGTIRGGTPAVPAPGHTWFTISGLNLEIWRQYQHTPLDVAKRMLKQSHQQVMTLIEGHSEVELFGRGIYKWTKTSTLGAYFIGSTSSHYEWAVKKIKKQIKHLKSLQ